MTRFIVFLSYHACQERGRRGHGPLALAPMRDSVALANTPPRLRLTRQRRLTIVIAGFAIAAAEDYLLLLDCIILPFSPLTLCRNRRACSLYIIDVTEPCQLCTRPLLAYLLFRR